MRDWLKDVGYDGPSRGLKYSVQLRYGDALAEETRNPNGTVPVFGSNGPVGVHDRANTDCPVIVVGRKGSFGKVNWSDRPAFAIDTTYYVDATSTVGDLRFAYYFLGALPLDSDSKDAAVPGLSREDAYRFRVPAFSTTQQRLIADFLDRKTSAIDDLIAKKQRFIELLEEKRAALINQAVTKGLDPSVPMKDSEIPWIGEIPAHWCVSQLKRLLRSFNYGTSDSSKPTGETRILGMGNIENGEIQVHGAPYQDDVDGNLLVRSGDLLFNRTNSMAHVGKVGLIRDGAPATLSFASYLVRLRTNDSAVPLFYRYFLNSQVFLAIGRSNAIPSINQANLSASRYVALHVLCPPLEEQREIAGHLERVSVSIEELCRRLSEQTGHLREYRQSLITAAVTGQLDVEVVDDEPA